MASDCEEFVKKNEDDARDEDDDDRDETEEGSEEDSESRSDDKSDDESDDDSKDEDDEETAKPKRRKHTGKKRSSESDEEPASAKATTEASGTLPMFSAILYIVIALVAGGAGGWFLHDARAGGSASADSDKPCEAWQEKICSGTSDTSAACSGAKSAAGMLPNAACQAALHDVPATLERIKAERAVCDKLSAKLCADLGQESTGCQMVKLKTPSIPTEACEKMTGEYDKVLADLKRMGQRPPMPGMGGPGMPPMGAPGLPAGHPRSAPASMPTGPHDHKH